MIPPTSRTPWCAIADDLYADDAAYVVNEAYEPERRDRIGRELRLGLGALRIASRSGGSVATLADVRDTIVATEIIERADFSESGLLTPDERRAVADLDRIIVANCGVGLSPQFGVLGPHVGRFDVTDPDAQPGATATTTSVAVAVVDTSTTSTSLPTRLPNAAVAVVGDSLTLGAQLEITATLSGLGLGVVDVDGQVSRRMTSSTDTIRSGLDVVQEIAAASSPRIWVVALGTNDVASGSSAGSIRDSVERVLAAILPTPSWCGSTPGSATSVARSSPATSSSATSWRSAPGPWWPTSSPTATIPASSAATASTSPRPAAPCSRT